jgi:hypothetical protein
LGAARHAHVVEAALFEEGGRVPPGAPAFLDDGFHGGVATCVVGVEDEEAQVLAFFVKIDAKDGISVNVSADHDRRSLLLEVVSESRSLELQVMACLDEGNLTLDIEEVLDA